MRASALQIMSCFPADEEGTAHILDATAQILDVPGKPYQPLTLKFSKCSFAEKVSEL